MQLILGNVTEDFERWYEHYYKFHLRGQRLAKSTIRTYTATLEKFKKYISDREDIKTLKNIKKEVIIDFLFKLEDDFGREHQPKTKKLYITILQSFFEHISINCDEDKNGEYYTFEREFKGVSPKNIKRKIKIKHLSKKDETILVDYLMSRLDTAPTHYDYIHSIGIKLMLYAGLRVTEMLHLKLLDINKYETDKTDKSVMEITLKDTKAGVEQYTYINKYYIEKELEYFQKTINENEYIFKGLKSKNNIDRSNFYKTISKVYKKAGISKKGLHILRHTSAMNLQDRTKDILVVQEHLRHISPSTTMIYLTTKKDALISAI